MSKTNKQILLFIIIVLIGVGYAVNEYIIIPEKVIIDQKTKQAQDDKQKLSLLNIKSAQVVKLRAEVAKLKDVAGSISDVTVVKIDTPQLIFDFYSSCKEYGVKGENLVFQLADSGTTANATTGTTTTGDTTNKSANGTQVTPPTTTTNSPADINKAKTTTDLLKLTIELKVSGDKNKVEKYIRNLNTLTTRKINVKKLKLEATTATVVNSTDGVSSTQIIPNTILTPGSTTIATPVTDQLTADIIFDQYIYNQGKVIAPLSNYSFYNGNTGFSNFSDMFK